MKMKTVNFALFDFLPSDFLGFMAPPILVGYKSLSVIIFGNMTHIFSRRLSGKILNYLLQVLVFRNITKCSLI